MIKKSVLKTEFDIAATLASGQTFAFTKIRDDAEISGVDRDGNALRRRVCFRGVVASSPVIISRVSVTGSDRSGMSGVSDGSNANGGYYEIECAARDEAFFRRYFDLDTSYGGLLAGFIDGGNCQCGCRHEYLARCVREFGGLRLLRQPVWETLCEFIISANNHQKRIESLYHRLSARYGERVGWDGDEAYRGHGECDGRESGERPIYYAFPSPERLSGASLDDLRALGLGYRAPYILDTAKVIADRGLLDLDDIGYDEALKALMTLRGVGEKVADCVLLFSTRHGVAFPVDVWMDRAMRELYGMTGTRKAIKRGAQAMFGDSAGLCQQFIFHGVRTGLGTAYQGRAAGFTEG